MRSLFFNSGCECVLEIEGESWSQADIVKGQLSIKKHSNSQGIKDLVIALSYGTFKQVHGKDAKAFTIIEQISLQNLEEDQSWQFNLSPACPITDKNGSLYITVGEKANPSSIGFMQLTIYPQKMIGEYLKIFENFHRFKIGPMKMKKTDVEVKMLPPASKEYGNVVGLNLLIKLVEHKMSINYHFKIKQLGISGDTVSAQVKSVEKKFNQVIDKKEYELFDGVANQEIIIERIREILHQVRPKIMY